MFEVRITDEAKRIIAKAVAEHEEPKAGLMIHRVGPVGEVSRGADGAAQWQIERRHPWAIQVGAWPNIRDDDENLVIVDGVRIWLPLIPRPGEKGVVVSAREGQLYVDGIDV